MSALHIITAAMRPAPEPTPVNYRNNIPTKQANSVSSVSIKKGTIRPSAESSYAAENAIFRLNFQAGGLPSLWAGLYRNRRGEGKGAVTLVS